MMYSLNFTVIPFFVKDKATRKIILQGRSRGGLYPVPIRRSSSSSWQAELVPSLQKHSTGAAMVIDDSYICCSGGLHFQVNQM
jgi:hypothetical protein